MTRTVETIFDEMMQAAISAHGVSTQAALWRLTNYGVDSGFVGLVRICATSADGIAAAYFRDNGELACTLHAVWTMEKEMERTEAMRKGDDYSSFLGWTFHQ